MTLFALPISTHVNKAIPKNAFDKYTNSLEKRDFVEKIDKIRWLSKISFSTVNLPSEEIQEIQIFEITLKIKDDIETLLKVIDKAIPYPIIFIIRHLDLIFISTSQKHPHPTSPDNAIIDWTFKTAWETEGELKLELNLKKNIDYIFVDFCRQLSGRNNDNMSLLEIIDKEKRVKNLEKLVKNIKADISRGKQFNLKLDLNKKLQEALDELDDLAV